MSTWLPEEFVGGHPALDFLNTVGDTGKSRDQSKISDWEGFSGWCAKSKLYSPGQLLGISKIKSSKSRDVVLTRIQAFREHAYFVLSAIVNEDEKAQSAISLLQEELLATMSRANLSIENGQTCWLVKSDNDQWIEDVLVLAIDDLIRSQGFPRIRQCGRCTWLFLDKGRGRGRRWCTMNKCGNREKTKRFRSR